MQVKTYVNKMLSKPEFETDSVVYPAGAQLHLTKVPKTTLKDASVTCYTVKGRGRADSKRERSELSTHSTQVPETTLMDTSVT